MMDTRAGPARDGPSAALVRALLEAPRISVVSAEPDHALDALAREIAPSVRIDGPDELAALLTALADAAPPLPPRVRTLDLHGHSTAATGLLRLGGWVIDAAAPGVRAWCAARAQDGVLARAGIATVRLLACRTAATEAGQATLRALAGLLDVEVYGTPHLLYGAHHDADGFAERYAWMLVAARALPARSPPSAATNPGPRTLALAALPSRPLGAASAGCPRWIASPRALPAVLALVARDAGAALPGPPPPASCELALPAAAGGYHVAHVVLGGAFLRVYPEDAGPGGILYPIVDPGALAALLAAP